MQLSFFPSNRPLSTSLLSITFEQMCSREGCTWNMFKWLCVWLELGTQMEHILLCESFISRGLLPSCKRLWGSSSFWFFSFLVCMFVSLSFLPYIDRSFALWLVRLLVIPFNRPFILSLHKQKKNRTTYCDLNNLQQENRRIYIVLGYWIFRWMPQHILAFTSIFVSRLCISFFALFFVQLLALI